MARGAHRMERDHTVTDLTACGNRLLLSLSPDDRALVTPHLSQASFARSAVLFEPGDDVTSCHFPCGSTMASLVVAMPEGALAETATVGREGAIGGIVSMGHKPAFARAVVQIGGAALRIETDRLEELKHRSTSLRDTVSRYADCLIAQVLQSVACNALHDLEARLCRWLLTVQDRVGGPEIPLTQEMLADMLGVQRTTVTAVASALQGEGLIRYQRGLITVLDRRVLVQRSCACRVAVLEHFDRVLPGVYPRHE